MKFFDKKHIIGLVIGVVVYELYHRSKGGTTGMGG